MSFPYVSCRQTNMQQNTNFLSIIRLKAIMICVKFAHQNNPTRIWTNEIVIRLFICLSNSFARGQNRKGLGLLNADVRFHRQLEWSLDR